MGNLVGFGLDFGLEQLLDVLFAGPAELGLDHLDLNGQVSVIALIAVQLLAELAVPRLVLLLALLELLELLQEDVVFGFEADLGTRYSSSSTVSACPVYIQIISNIYQNAVLPRTRLPRRSSPPLSSLFGAAALAACLGSACAAGFGGVSRSSLLYSDYA